MKAHISIRSGWRCINDDIHDWQSVKTGQVYARCSRCNCNTNAVKIWTITARHPVYGLIQRACPDANEAFMIINLSDPFKFLFEGPKIKLGNELRSVGGMTR